MSIKSGDKPLEVLPNGRPVWAYKINKAGKRVPCCGSERTSEGLPPCEATILYENGRCKKHGGPLAKMRGLAHPVYLRSPERMPARLRKEMEAALADRDITDLKHELALVDVNIARLKDQLESGFDPNVWRRLAPLAEALQHALDTDDERGSEIAQEIVNTIRFGYRENAAHNEIQKAALIRTKIAETQVKNTLAMKTVLPGEEALALGIAMTSVVRRETPKLLEKIQADFKIKLPSTYQDAYLLAVAQGLGQVVTSKGKLTLPNEAEM